MRPGGTRVPTPNTKVKARAADGTAPGTARESRRPPDAEKEEKRGEAKEPDEASGSSGGFGGL